jgi:hypothetical protein
MTTLVDLLREFGLGLVFLNVLLDAGRAADSCRTDDAGRGCAHGL